MSPKRDAGGRVRSRGRQRLLEELRRASQADFARRVRLRQSTISKLLARGTTDSYATRKALEERAAIPMHAWDEPEIRSGE